MNEPKKISKKQLFILSHIPGDKLKNTAERTGINYDYCRELWARQEVKDAVASRDIDSIELLNAQRTRINNPETPTPTISKPTEKPAENEQKGVDYAHDSTISLPEQGVCPGNNTEERSFEPNKPSFDIPDIIARAIRDEVDEDLKPIADRQEVQKFLTNVMRDNVLYVKQKESLDGETTEDVVTLPADIKSRLKAAELHAKTLGMFIETKRMVFDWVTPLLDSLPQEFRDKVIEELRERMLSKQDQGQIAHG